MTTGLDIVIVNFNTRDDTLACLASIFANPPRSLATVYVVDNGSTDGSVEAIRGASPRVTIVPLGRNAGFGAANNVALRQASAPLVLLLNSDTVVPAGAIDILADRLTTTGAVAAGPRLVDANGRPEVSFGSMLTPVSELRQAIRGRIAASDAGWAKRSTARLLADEQEVDWVSGACLLLKREAAAAAAFFDERFFLYEEDVDLCAALRAAGGRILFTPRTEVMHRRGRSGAGRTDHYDRSHLAFYEKHAPGWLWWLRGWQAVRGRRVR
jgi:GT2 family glycosyltransferase